LRHADYRQLFVDCGFELIEEMTNFAAGYIPPAIAEKFAGSEDTWAATSGHFVLKKR
jgi:hypothetical protein